MPACARAFWGITRVAHRQGGRALQEKRRNARARYSHRGACLHSRAGCTRLARPKGQHERALGQQGMRDRARRRLTARTRSRWGACSYADSEARGEGVDACIHARQAQAKHAVPAGAVHVGVNASGTDHALASNELRAAGRARTRMNNSRSHVHFRSPRQSIHDVRGAKVPGRAARIAGQVRAKRQRDGVPAQSMSEAPAALATSTSTPPGAPTAVSRPRRFLTTCTPSVATTTFTPRVLDLVQPVTWSAALRTLGVARVTRRPGAGGVWDARVRRRAQGRVVCEEHK